MIRVWSENETQLKVWLNKNKTVHDTKKNIYLFFVIRFVTLCAVASDSSDNLVLGSGGAAKVFPVICVSGVTLLPVNNLAASNPFLFRMASEEFCIFQPTDVEIS